MKKTALLIIDIQNDYFPKGKMILSEAETAAKKASLLLNFARDNEMEVIFMQHFAVQPNPVFFLPDTTGAEIHTSVTPLKHEKVINKNFPNSFRETGLDEHLKSKQISQLLICGMMSHMCVDATTRAAFDKGYTCILAHDSCATRELTFQDQSIKAEDVHGAFMAALGARYARVASTTECIDYLSTHSANM